MRCHKAGAAKANPGSAGSAGGSGRDRGTLRLRARWLPLVRLRWRPACTETAPCRQQHSGGTKTSGRGFSESAGPRHQEAAGGALRALLIRGRAGAPHSCPPILAAFIPPDASASSLTVAADRFSQRTGAVGAQGPQVQHHVSMADGPTGGATTGLTAPLCTVFQLSGP